MTTLKETLSILGEAVPALVTKVEAVDRQGEAFLQAGRETIAQLQSRSSAAEEMVTRLGGVFDAVAAHAKAEQARLQTVMQALHEAVEHETEGCSEATQDLELAADRAGGASSALETRLTQVGERTGEAHEKSRAALAGLGETAHASQGELQAAGEESAAAFQATQQAVAEAQPLVNEGVTALREGMANLVSAAEERLSQIQQRLGELSAEQQAATGEAIAALEASCEEQEQQITQRLEGDLRQSLEAELEAVGAAFAAVAQQVEALRAETTARRESLVGELASVAERIPPLQLATQQVQVAADKVGLAWP